jgi:hypothetical protein
MGSSRLSGTVALDQVDLGWCDARLRQRLAQQRLLRRPARPSALLGPSWLMAVLRMTARMRSPPHGIAKSFEHDHDKLARQAVGGARTACMSRRGQRPQTRARQTTKVTTRG